MFNTKKQNSWDSSPKEEKDYNIFDDFEADIKIKEEINAADKLNKRDSTYYVFIISYIFKYINILLFIILILLFSYLSIQNNDKLEKNELLNPFCNILLWEVSNKEGWCSWITKTINDYKLLIDEEWKKQYTALVLILEAEQNKNNILKSKEFYFILETTKNKINPIFILSEFDRVRKKILKNEFSVQCENISIEKDILNMSCKAYSIWSNQDIDMLSWNNKIVWTSISMAAAFYKNLEDDWTFSVLTKENSFSNSPYSSDKFTYFTLETSFNVSLKYNGNKF